MQQNRLFHIHVVRDGESNGEGRWIERVVPDQWPSDDEAQSHMLRTAPDYGYVPAPGLHVVSVREVSPGPSDQPGSMREAAGFAAGDFDDVQVAGMRF